MEYNDKTKEFLFISEEYKSKKLITEEQINILYKDIKDIINNDFWQKIKNYPHHNEHNRGEHLIRVCLSSYIKALKSSNCDPLKTAQGALLHDIFDYDWKIADSHIKYNDKEIEKLKDKHAFMHPTYALEEAKKHFPDIVDAVVENIILSHMWPLTKLKPKYKEAWLVNIADLTTSFEVFKNIKELPKYVDIRRKKK